MSLAAVGNACEVWRWYPLEHMGRYVPPRDLGRSNRNNAIWAKLTRACNVGKFSTFPASHAMARNRYEVMSYVHDSPTTRQLSACQNILQKMRLCVSKLFGIPVLHV